MLTLMRRLELIDRCEDTGAHIQRLEDLLRACRITLFKLGTAQELVALIDREISSS